ncbi:unnamed protein product [Rotaria sordida]|uniref:Uncharacterized protein n=1 Tax=Rotaria sordida TaxID=392033 RepID=A0A814Y6X8_9BILA|nr:unnamed protein product [Rotaria sordida]
MIQQTISTVYQQKNEVDDDIFNNDIIDEENHDEEQFRIQSSENDKKLMLVHTRIDYQYRSDILINICLYEFVSTLYKKKMNASDMKYLSKPIALEEEEANRKGRPPNERYPFQKQHSQVATDLMMRYSEPHVPVLYGPQIPRRDRDDTRERYCRAFLTLFVPLRTVSAICDVNQTWKGAFKSRQHRISTYLWKIIENIQLLHECKKDRNEHLLQIISEAQTENDTIDPVLLLANQNVNGEFDDMDNNEDLLELLGKLDEYTIALAVAAKKSTEKIYIEETIEAVQNVGRFTRTDTHREPLLSEVIDHTNRQIVSFVSATSNLIRLNTKWQQQLKAEKERLRRSLITSNYDNSDDTLEYDSVIDAIVTLINPNNYNSNTFENYSSIPPVISLTTSYSTQKSIADEYTSNREQRAAFMIITSHLDGDKRCHTDMFTLQVLIIRNIMFIGGNDGQLIMCIPGCGGTGNRN